MPTAGGWQRYFLITLALAVSLVLAGALIRGRHTAIESMGYSLILGGALGNAIDRMVRGHVVDYLDFYWQDWHWPAFNLADTAITLGAPALLLRMLASVRRPSS